MSTVRIAIPANATIIKGSLRNLLDGSRRGNGSGNAGNGTEFQYCGNDR